MQMGNLSLFWQEFEALKRDMKIKDTSYEEQLTQNAQVMQDMQSAINSLNERLQSYEITHPLTVKASQVSRLLSLLLKLLCLLTLGLDLSPLTAVESNLSGDHFSLHVYCRGIENLFYSFEYLCLTTLERGEAPFAYCCCTV